MYKRQCRSSAASDVYRRQIYETAVFSFRLLGQPRGAVNTEEYSHPKIVCGTEVTSVAGRDGWYRFAMPNYKSVYTSDAAGDPLRVDIRGGRRFQKKKLLYTT